MVPFCFDFVSVALLTVHYVGRLFRIDISLSRLSSDSKVCHFQVALKCSSGAIYHFDQDQNSIQRVTGFFAMPAIHHIQPDYLSIHLSSAAIGAGLGLAVACDMRIVAENAKLGFTFATLGLHPGMGTTHTVPRVC